MRKAFLLFLLFLSNSSAADVQGYLDKGIAFDACKYNQPEILKECIEDYDVAPPFSLAAKYGHPEVVAVITRYNNKRLSPLSRARILNRLILTGNPNNVRSFFNKRILKKKDITPKALEFAKERLEKSGNPTIVNYLQNIQQSSTNPNRTKRHKRNRAITAEKHPNKRSKTKDQKKELPFCVICQDTIKKSKKSISGIACSHVLHRECAQKWYKSADRQQCPTCRKPEDKRDGIVPVGWMQWLYGRDIDD